MQYLKKRWSEEGGYRQLLVIAIPLIVSTGAWSIQNFVDRMFLAWYSPETIAAASPAGILFFVVISLFFGTAGYMSTFVAQYYGAGRYHRIGPAIWQGIYISVIGGLITISLIPFAGSIFHLIGHDILVQKEEVTYFQVLCFGGGPSIASSAISGFFAGRGRPWPIMWVTCFATVVNIILDYALIFGNWGLPEMGIKGAGIATVISQVFSMVTYMTLASRRSNNKTYHTLKGWKPEKDLIVRILRFGLPSGVHFFLDIGAFTVFILIIGHLGTNSLAATNIAFNINSLAFMPMLGCGMAISVLVGQYLGDNMPDLAERTAYSGFHIVLIYMVTLSLAYVLIPDFFVGAFAAKADPDRFAEIYNLSVVLLRFVAVYAAFDGMIIVFASAIKGAGDTRFVMFMIVIASVAVLIVPTFTAVIILGYGIMACWFFASSYVIILSFIFYFRFLRGKWKSMRVI